MSRNRSRLSYRAKKRRQKRIILVICTVAAFFLVCAGLMFLIQGADGFGWLRKNSDVSQESQSGEDTPSTGDSQQGTEDSTEPGGEGQDSTEETGENPGSQTLTIEDVWANDTRTPVEVRGVYLSAAGAARNSTRETVISLLDNTEINAVVIDVKDDEGYLTVDLGIDLATEVGATVQCTFTVDEFKSLMSTLKEHGAYLIARIAAFRDNVLTLAKPECSLWWKEEWGGEIYKDTQGYYWLDAGNEIVRQYLLDISQAAVDLGFDEIQYDYVRFPTTYIGRVNYYGGTGYYEEDGVTYNLAAAAVRKETITSYVEYVCRELVPQGVFVSADVYGTIIGNEEDSGNVGQDYAQLAHWLDYICPMVYPSHYTNPVYGVTHPDLEPYTVVNGAMKDSKTELAVITDAGEHCGIVRPWMQTFTATWLDYHKEYSGTELRQQIDAVYDAGYTEWLLWNSSGAYENYRSGIMNK